MKIFFIFTFFIVFILAGSGWAQEQGKVIVTKDPLIDSLIKKRLELNAGSSSLIFSDGYRVQIFAGLERAEAYLEQTRFKEIFPGIGSYISYVQPNYRLRVGDFRTRLEAEKFLNELRPRYPSLFIFSEKINLR